VIFMFDFHFFALRDDLVPVLDAAERIFDVKYVLAGMFESSSYEIFNHGRDIPNLGEAEAASAVSCACYLVTMRATPVNVEPRRTIDGQRYCINQRINRDSITFSPGGLWREDILLYGRVATISASDLAQELLKGFGGPIMQQFRKVNAFYVGPQAFEMLEAGKRLTWAEQTPRDHDLKIPQ
jgi:hypothetical protein